MIYKTSAIVLRQQKHTDNKRIVNIFTKTSGRKSFIVVTGSRSKKINLNIFQPFFILNIEFSHKQNQNIGNLKEASIEYPFKSIAYETQKSAIAFFLSEILMKVFDDNYVDENFFDFLYKSIIKLDNHEKPANFHLAFLTETLKFLGITPVMNYSEELKYFNIPEASFKKEFCKENCMDEKTSHKFVEIYNAGLTKFDEVHLIKNERKILLDKILDFYTYHFSHLKNLKSLNVLEQLFGH